MRTLPLLLTALSAFLTSCSTNPNNSRPLHWSSTPQGASIEMVTNSKTYTKSTSQNKGSIMPVNPYTGQVNYNYFMTQNNGTGQAVTTRKIRKIRGYTPFTHSWYDCNDPSDYVTVRKGDRYAVVFVTPGSSAVHVNFSSTPPTVTGARLLDSN